MSEASPQPQQPDFVEIQRMETANGVERLYGVDEAGKKHQVSFAAVAEMHGHEVGQPANGGENSAPQAEAQPSIQDQLKAHANWQMRVDTTDMHPDQRGPGTPNNIKPSERDLTAEDVAYNEWLKGSAKDAHNGLTLNQLDKADKEALAAAERREMLREKARMNMRVKTGAATGEEAAYYYTLQEMDEENSEQTPEDPAEQKPAGEGSGENDPTDPNADPDQDDSEKQEPEPKTGEEEEEEDEEEANGEKSDEDGEKDPNDPDNSEDDKDSNKQDGDEPDKTGRSKQEIEADTQETLEAREADQEFLGKVRDEYLKRVAGRSRRALTFGKYSEKGVEAAKAEYEKIRDDIFASELEYLQKKFDLDKDTLDMVMVSAAFGEQRKLAQELHLHRLAATGNYKFKEVATEKAVYRDVEEVKKGVIGRQMHKLYSWFGRTNTSGKWYGKGSTARKGAAMVGIGAAIGVTGALLLPGSSVVAAGAGGALLVNRLTKAYMSVHFKRKGEDAAMERHADARLKGLLAELGNGTKGAEMTDLLDTQAKREVKRNRRRGAATVGAAALGGALGAELVDALGGETNRIPFFGDNDGGNGSESSEKPDDTEPGDDKKDRGDDRKDRRDGERIDLDGNFNVEQGNGITHEIMDSAKAQGIDLTPEQAYNIYQGFEGQGEMVDLLGTNNDEYTLANGEQRISSAGQARWTPQFENYLEEELEKAKKTA